MKRKMSLHIGPDTLAILQSVADEVDGSISQAVAIVAKAYRNGRAQPAILASPAPQHGAIPAPAQADLTAIKSPSRPPPVHRVARAAPERKPAARRTVTNPGERAERGTLDWAIWRVASYTKSVRARPGQSAAPVAYALDVMADGAADGPAVMHVLAQYPGFSVAAYLQGQGEVPSAEELARVHEMPAHLTPEAPQQPITPPPAPQQPAAAAPVERPAMGPGSLKWWSLQAHTLRTEYAMSEEQVGIRLRDPSMFLAEWKKLGVAPIELDEVPAFDPDEWDLS